MTNMTRLSQECYCSESKLENWNVLEEQRIGTIILRFQKSSMGISCNDTSGSMPLAAGCIGQCIRYDVGIYSDGS